MVNAKFSRRAAKARKYELKSGITDNHSALIRMIVEGPKGPRNQALRLLKKGPRPTKERFRGMFDDLLSERKGGDKASKLTAIKLLHMLTTVRADKSRREVQDKAWDTLMHDKDPKVREKAIVGAGRFYIYMNDISVQDKLRDMLRRSSSLKEKRLIAKAIRNISKPEPHLTD